MELEKLDSVSLYIYSAVITGETLGCLRIYILAFAFFSWTLHYLEFFCISHLSHDVPKECLSIFFMLNKYLSDGFQCVPFTVTSFGRIFLSLHENCGAYKQSNFLRVTFNSWCFQPFKRTISSGFNFFSISELNLKKLKLPKCWYVCL